LELVSKKDKSSIGGNNGSVSNIQAAILRAMFRPYFFAPLLGYAYGNRARVRSCIEITSLNAATSIISTRDILPSLRYCGVRAKLKAIKNLFLITFNIWRFNRIVLSINRGDSFTDNINNLLKLLGDIDTMNNESPYLAYYKNKNEDVSWAYSVQWNDKQKTVYQALNQQNISSVIDVACNTGWYAILAESLGKKVIAFDIDEACVDFLYKHVKKEGLNILPLVMDFTNLTKNRHSILDGKKILINAVDRFKSDSVIALGIIHHLFLGMGIGFDEIVMKLNSLSKRQMLIEYIHPSDLVIQEERSFFPAYLKNEKLIEAYNLNNLIIEIEKYGYIINVQKSYPQTRLILECTKFST
jgi:SAM-dependent methyltransferase